MGEKLPEAFWEVEIIMQEDFKNQLQNAVGLWRKKGQAALDEFLKDAKGEIRTRLSQQGVAERWPALVNIIEEFIPEIAPSIAGIIGRRVEPLADWLGVTVKNWDQYKIELSVSAEKHLSEKDSWQTSSFVAMAEIAARWLIEKHSPPGDLKIRVLKAEIETLNSGLTDCTVRCELDAADFELTLSQLLKTQETDLFLTVLILSNGDVLLSQANFHFELRWSPLLK
jgi:hypothetical protein